MMILTFALLTTTVSAKSRVNLLSQIMKRPPTGQLGRGARSGAALCALRENDDVCCDGISLHCYGCNPDLLALGVKCADQPVAKVGTGIVGKDCFCDESCRDFQDCCDDYDELCPDPNSTQRPDKTKTTTTSTTTSTSTTSSTRTTRTTSVSNKTTKTATSTTTTMTTTRKTKPPKTTDSASSESWIFTRLFAAFKLLIDTKFGLSGEKYTGLMKKYENVKFFYLNAEHNCKIQLEGKFSNEVDEKKFNSLLRKIEKKPNLSIEEKIVVMRDGLISYAQTYFYNATVSHDFESNYPIINLVFL